MIARNNNTFLERLALNGIKEVRNDKNVNSAIAHLDSLCQ